jgi:epoxide hydrolase
MFCFDTSPLSSTNRKAAMNFANSEEPVVSRRNLFQLLAAAGASAASIGMATAAEQKVIGPLTLPKASEALTPFQIKIPQSALDDLRQRLRSTRFPEKETVSDWTQGVPLAKARALVAYWRDHYNWRRFESRVNALPQFRTEINGLGIHFIHVKSREPNALPIILTHGWPGSFVEFLKVIGPMTNPTAHGGSAADAFDVVIPCQPGFGFSDKPTATGWNVVKTAQAWGVLMKRLGYTRWVAQGGDWGSGVTHALGHVRPDGLVAAHVNWPLVFPAKLPENPSPDEQRAMSAAQNFGGDQSGYFRQQATRPQTIGYALADSPAGQAMWIYEKFQAWTDNQGQAEDALSVDEMLDNITLYWLTDTAASSARIYWENARNGGGFDAGRIELPMAATIFPNEIYRAPKSWAQEHWPNLFYWNEVDRGGHFAAFEQPQLFTDELRNAFRSQRKS